MLDVLKRALLHPSDYHNVVRATTLTFKEKIEEQPGVWSFIFTPTKPLSWKAGQHAIFSMPGRQITGKAWRPFSVASSVHEGVVRIGTNIPPTPSSFKTELMKLVAGDTIHIRGPFGEFHANGTTETIIGVAGGIGITPFRALAYDIAHHHLPTTTLHLIYSARTEHTYRSELDSWCAMTDRLSIEYVHTPEAVTDAFRSATATHRSDSRYFLSGAPTMISSLITTCRSFGVRRIVNDPFKGY